MAHSEGLASAAQPANGADASALRASAPLIGALAPKGKALVNETSEELKLSSPPSEDFVFAIMPFGGYFDKYYENVYGPAIEDAGLSHKRADNLYRPSTIVNDIWSYTKTCRLVLADLTGKNPNVLYELGLAHAIAKPGILITENLDDIPFDLRALRIIEYDKNDYEWGSILRKKITQAIREVLDSPLRAVLPAFLDIDSSAPRVSVSETDKQLIEITQELDALRREIRVGRGKARQQSSEVSREVADAILEEIIRNNPRIPIRTLLGEMSQYGCAPEWIVERSKEIRQQIDDEIPF